MGINGHDPNIGGKPPTRDISGKKSGGGGWVWFLIFAMFIAIIVAWKHKSGAP